MYNLYSDHNWSAGHCGGGGGGGGGGGRGRGQQEPKYQPRAIEP